MDTSHHKQPQTKKRKQQQQVIVIDDDDDDVSRPLPLPEGKILIQFNKSFDFEEDEERPAPPKAITANMEIMKQASECIERMLAHEMKESRERCITFEITCWEGMTVDTVDRMDDDDD